MTEPDSAEEMREAVEVCKDEHLWQTSLKAVDGNVDNTTTRDFDSMSPDRIGDGARRGVRVDI